MQMLSTQSFEEIRRWMYRNARPLELARWQYHFEDGSAKNVLCALSAFQNEDGGFGHALDCDNWNPNSTPYNAGLAIEIFRELGIYNPHHPIVEKTFAFLDSGIYFLLRRNGCLRSQQTAITRMHPGGHTARKTMSTMVITRQAAS